MEIRLRPTDPVDALDRVMRSIRYPGTEVVLAPGRYLTRGAWAFREQGHRTQGSGVILRSSGEGRVEVALSPSAERAASTGLRSQRDLQLWTTEPGAIIRGIAFDANEAAFRDADPAKTWYPVVGVRAFGRITIEDFEVTGLRGVRAPQAGLQLDNEAFALSTVGADGGSVIRRGRIHGCAPSSYVTAVNVGHVGAGGLVPMVSRVEDVSVALGAGNWMALGVNQSVHVTRFSLDGGCANGVYNDTDTTADVLVEDSIFLGCDRLVSLVAPAEQRTPRGGVHLRKVSATLVGDGAGEARMVELWDQASALAVPAVMGPVTIESCLVEAPSAFYALAAVGRQIQPVVAINSTFPDYRVAGAATFLPIACSRADGKSPARIA